MPTNQAQRIVLECLAQHGCVLVLDRARVQVVASQAVRQSRARHGWIDEHTHRQLAGPPAAATGSTNLHCDRFLSFAHRAAQRARTGQTNCGRIALATLAHGGYRDAIATRHRAIGQARIFSLQLRAGARRSAAQRLQGHGHRYASRCW